MSVRYYCDVCETEQLFNQTASVAVQIGSAGGTEPSSKVLKLDHVCLACRTNMRTALDRFVDAKGTLAKL